MHIPPHSDLIDGPALSRRTAHIWILKALMRSAAHLEGEPRLTLWNGVDDGDRSSVFVREKANERAAVIAPLLFQ